MYIIRITPSILLLVLATVTRVSLAHEHGECESNDECMHGGVCDLDVTDTNDLNHLNKVCHCMDDYIGPYCTDQCLITCQNGGVCTRQIADEHGGAEIDSSEFICQCPSPYDGPLREDIKAENDATSSPSMAPSTSESSNSVQSSAKTDPMSSSVSMSKIFGIVFGVGIAAAVLIVYAIYSKRRTKSLMDGSRQNKTIDGTSISSVSNDVANTSDTDDGSIGNHIVTTT